MSQRPWSFQDHSKKPTTRTIKLIPAHTDDNDPPPLSTNHLLKFLSPSRRHHVKQENPCLDDPCENPGTTGLSISCAGTGGDNLA
jgi:hypothetical protein